MQNFSDPSYPVTMTTRLGHMGGAKISAARHPVLIIERFVTAV